jgi:hypothetical protein
MSISQTIKGEKYTFEISSFLIRKSSVWRQAVLLFKTKSKLYDKNKLAVLRFEISSDKMNFLLSNHQICAADIRCLDANSKQLLKKLCLQTCLHNISQNCHLSREI